MKGILTKMKSSLNKKNVSYSLNLYKKEDKSLISLNDLIGSVIELKHTGKKFCISCGANTRKTFQQGYCYKCFATKAECDSCIMSPELCHFDEGTCRDEDWAQSHCMVPHFVYLSFTSNVKVGITRATQIPTRWVDQGAKKALLFAKVFTRYQSGLIEVELKKYVKDKTSWQKMLKNEGDEEDLEEKRSELLSHCERFFDNYREQFGEDSLEIQEDKITEINYPVKNYPKKVKSLNFDKGHQIKGELQGIKGQYLIFSDFVFNVRKHTGYEIEFIK